MKAIFSMKDLETLLTPEAAKRVGVNNADPLQSPLLVRASMDAVGDGEGCLVIDVEFNPEAKKRLIVAPSKARSKK